MALNLDQAGYLDLLGIVPTYGNATLAAEMLVAREIAQTLKGRDDLPLVPGATSPVSQVLHPSPTWFDGKTVPVEGANGSFAAACSNAGVFRMAELIDAASEPVGNLHHP